MLPDGEEVPVFVYGSLMSTRVLQALLQRVPAMRPAVLPGFTRYRIRDEVFPAILPSTTQDASVVGVVLVGLNAREREILDFYEDDGYVKQLHSVVLVTNDADIRTGSISKVEELSCQATSTTGGQTSHTAVVKNPKAQQLVNVYVWRSTSDASAGAAQAQGDGGVEQTSLLFGEWDYKTHFEPHEDEYVAMCEQYAACGFKWPSDESSSNDDGTDNADDE
jgi:gamma-glutamylcyclotransferase (GGCT)/AIG2-like uncharacterized protein YtfP